MTPLPPVSDDDDDGVSVIELQLEATPERLDKALSQALPEVSRARIQALLAGGAISRDDQPLTAGSRSTEAGLYRIVLPAPIAAEPEPEALPLTILFEDADLVVVDKPAGMATHPAPGSETGTLVNALLHHCGASLSGIGGVARPGIVHRLDKGTSGVMVAAKSDRAHQGLSALFATHDIQRTYIALTRGTLTPERGRIESRLGRSTHDRKKMAVLKTGGREAVTDYVVERTFGHPAKAGGAPLAARIACTLHTGRTHQIRVHMASKGAPLLGDPVYGSGPPAQSVRDAIAASGLDRQALHAALLGFVHPVSGEVLRFETEPPADMQALQHRLQAL